MPSQHPLEPNFPTIPAFVYDFPNDDFDNAAQRHPALACLARHLRDATEPCKLNISPEDHEIESKAYLMVPIGRLTGDAVETYKVLAKAHEKYILIFYEFDNVVIYNTDWGNRLLGTASFYFRSRGLVHSGKSCEVRSRDGKFWEDVRRGAYVISFRDLGGLGVQIDGWEIYNPYLTDEEWNQADEEAQAVSL